MEYNKGLFAWIRKTSFTKFFVAWLIAVFAFSIIYWLASPLNSLILNNEPLMLSVTGLFRSMFASLLVGTIFGFGKLVFNGLIAVVVYIQLIFSIIILLILVDKIIQKYVMPHYHNTHHHDKKVHTMVLMMSIFRQDIDRIMHEFRTKKRTHISIKEIEAIIDGLYVVFLDIEKIFSLKNIERHKIRNMQYFILSENVEASLEKLHEFIEFAIKHDIEWKDKSTEFWIRYILETAEKIVTNMEDFHLKNPKNIIAIENIRDYADKINQRI
ncbi:TPA: hypothetical protein HA235_01955 [Candidatus Woesearchaeota archaeon]|nr:hypothetical protein [Candidatus Woesearchaeota archaeon]HIH31447.1 hypothetical protein [Candidatus Woesearchaeota archaeon]HIH54246.1 hypothetical protein [Candidatus Woesearchaeota archaeon]HIJ02616.1 hypothetical protein [Candidatus Woesearchaeota archaeon]HIJ14547.1 hypothetical protein [Candidatus Woesearchaeota archaeon]